MLNIVVKCSCFSLSTIFFYPLLYMGGNTPKEWKNGIFVPFFSLFVSCFVIFALRNRCVGSANEYWFWGWVLIRCWLFHCWFVDGCFIADEYFFASECFFEGGFGRVEEWMVWFDLIGRGDGWILAEGVLTRARMRALVLGVLFFCCHKCHSGWNWEYFIIHKTTRCFP